MRIELFLADDSRTAALGRALARLVRPGDVIALRGGLGAGKTALARGLIRALCGAETEVPSPTFTLLQTYDAPGLPIYHFDLYRLETPDALIELGWEETVDGLALIEWPERAGAHLPDFRLDLTLKPEDTGRIAALEPHGEDWRTRLDGFRI